MISVCASSLGGWLLVFRGWDQYKGDLLMAEGTEYEQLAEAGYEGLLENVPQLATGQVGMCLVFVVVYSVGQVCVCARQS
jgi:hypothetical protein